MNRNIALILLCVTGIASAATEVVEQPGTWDLYKGTARVSSWRTYDECKEAAASAGVTAKYGCRTITRIDVVVKPDPPNPVPDPPNGKPTAANTGPKGALTQRGAFTVNTPGVVENFHATGTVKITASNVTLRNFKVTTSSDNCVRVEEGARNVVLEDGECDGAASSGVTGEGFTARRLYIHNMGSDAFHLNDAGHVTIEASYITDLGYKTSSHADGVQVSSGTNITIRGNHFYMPGDDPKYNNSQIFMIKPDAGPISNLRIEGNWLNGGGYSVNMAGANTNVSITNNRFGKEYSFGPLRLSGSPQVCGNVWDSDSSLLSQNPKCP